MQGFVQKISESKGKLLFGLGGVALVGIFGYLYNQYKNQQSIAQQQPLSLSQPDPIENFKLQEQIAKFKATLNLTNPSLQQVKRMLAYSAELTQKEMQRVNADFKKSRRILHAQGDLKQYFKTVGVGFIRLKQIAGSLQQAIMELIGIVPQMIVPYQQQLAEFMYEQQMERSLGNKSITLGEVKKAINTQLSFITEHGDELVSAMIEHCKDWQKEAKKFIPDVFTIYLADQIAVKHPEMDRYDMRGAQKRFEKYLVAETAAMKQHMQPKVTRLITDLGIYSNQ